MRILLIIAFLIALVPETPGARAGLFILAVGAIALTRPRDHDPLYLLPSLITLILMPLGLVLFPGVSYPPTRFAFTMILALFAAAREGRYLRTRPIFLLAFFMVPLLFILRAVCQYEDLQYGLDLAHVGNILSNTLKGRVFFSDIIGGSIISHHLYLVLLPLAPLYGFAPHPLTLQFIQTASLMISALVIRGAFLRRFENPALGNIIGVVFLLHPAFTGEAMSEFDPASIGVLGLAIAAYAHIVGRRSGLFWLGVIIALVSKEQFALGAIPAGIILAFGRRRRRGIVLALLGLTWIAGDLFVLQPYLFGGGGAGVLQARVRLGPILDEPDISSAAALAIQTILSPGKIGYILHLLVPLSLLPLASPISIAALPEIGISLISIFPMYHMGAHYAALSLPVLVIAAGLAAARLRRLGAHRALLAAAIAGAVLSNLGPFSHTGGFYSPVTTNPLEIDDIWRAAGAVPEEGSIGFFGGHRLLVPFSSRDIRIELPYLPDSAERASSADILIYDNAEVPEDVLAGRRLIGRFGPVTILGEEVGVPEKDDTPEMDEISDLPD